MSVRIFPCFGCPLRDGCQLRGELRTKASGIGARSVAFPCPHLAKEIRTGRRIIIRHPFHVEYDCDGEYGVAHEEVKATITSASPHYRFACVIDPGENRDGAFDGEHKKYRFRKTQAHFRIVRFLDEPDASLCEFGNVLRDADCDALDRCNCKQWAAAAEAMELDEFA